MSAEDDGLLCLLDDPSPVLRGYADEVRRCARQLVYARTYPHRRRHAVTLIEVTSALVAALDEDNDADTEPLWDPAPP